MSFNKINFRKLEEVSDVIDSLHETPKYSDDGYFMVRVTDIKPGLLKFDNAFKVSEDVYEKFSRKHKPVKGDIVISRVGSYNGITSYLNDDTLFCLGQNTAIIHPKSIDSVYLYYNMQSNYIKNQISQFSVGSAKKTISLKSIKSLSIPYCEMDEQKKIGKILLDIDNKIEVNSKINKRLEDMVQAIFKQWFLDFEFPNEEGKPYKSSGGEMVESELGMIPNGWEVGVFRNYITDILGGDWGKEQPQGNYIKDVYCVRGADIPEINKGNKGKSPIRFILEKNLNNKKLTCGDLIVEISGGSPTQSTGRIAYINKSVLDKFDKGLVCTNFCRAITLKDRNLMEFVYIYWTYLYDLDVFFQFENGTTGIKNLDINNFLDRNSIINPPKKMIEKFYDTVNNLFIMIQKNGKENEKLSNLRDTLLPKLMSGEIRVPTDK